MTVAFRQAPTPYEDHRDHVLGVLAARCRWVSSGDREALYHEAYVSMLDLERSGRLELRAMHPRQVRAYLSKAAVHKALDERKSAETRLTAPLDPAAENRPDPSRPVDERVAGRLDSRAIREIVSELSRRQQAVVVAERDAHQRTLRAQRLPEHPPALRKGLRGRGADSLDPEQVASLLPKPFLR